jgi:PilZ domain
METSVESGDKQRVARRISTTMPARLQYQTGKTGGWDEVSRLVQVSPLGCGVRLKHLVEAGRLVLLTLPLLPELRRFDFSEPQYKIWGVVRYINWEKVSYNQRGEASLYEIGIAFVGKEPPDSYKKDPATTYEISGFNKIGLWQVKEGKPDTSLPTPRNYNEGRNDGRFMIPLNVTIEVLSETGTVAVTESSVTENVSLSGASVFTTLTVKTGTYVRMVCPEYNISVLSLVRSRDTGADGFTRLHLEFVDQQFPLQGIEK